MCTFLCIVGLGGSVSSFLGLDASPLQLTASTSQKLWAGYPCRYHTYAGIPMPVSHQSVEIETLVCKLSRWNWMCYEYSFLLCIIYGVNLTCSFSKLGSDTHAGITPIRSGNSGWRATSWKCHCKFVIIIIIIIIIIITYCHYCPLVQMRYPRHVLFEGGE